MISRCHHLIWGGALGAQGVNRGIVLCLLEAGDHIVRWYFHFIRVEGQYIFYILKESVVVCCRIYVEGLEC